MRLMAAVMAGCAGLGTMMLLGAAGGLAGSAAKVTSPLPSQFAPAGDLQRQADQLVKDLREVLAEGSDYGEEQQQRVAQNANALAVLALVLGNHDEANSLRQSAGPIIDSALAVAGTAGDRGEAQRAMSRLEGAMKTQSTTNVGWKMVGDIQQIMLAVPILNQSLRRGVSGKRFDRTRDQSAALAAALAAIAHVSLLDETYCRDHSEQVKWDEYCRRMREQAADCNRAVRAGNQDAAKEAMKEMTRACDDCHDHFQVE